MKTFELGSKSIIGLGRAKQAVERHTDLLAVCERNVDLESFHPAEFAGVEVSVAGDRAETLSVQGTSRRFGTILLC